MERNETRRSKKWVVPGLALLIGGAYFLANWIGGNPAFGASLFVIMLVYAALLLLGGRFEIFRALRGQFDDERYRSFDLQATAYAGGVTILVLIGGFIYELAQGKDGQPYSLLCAVFGVSYLVALILLRWRS